MRIIISPAKKMNRETDSLPYECLPQFWREANAVLRCLRGMDYAGLKALWRCSDSIAILNYERLRKPDLQHCLSPALLAYEGIQYRYMAPGVFTDSQLAYCSRHLRIVSGLYGLLRPFDGIMPYRLEMQAKLSVDGRQDLYRFWGDKLARQLGSETGLIVNLASKEYSKVVSAQLPAAVRFLSCSFGELKAGRLIEKGTLCKMARGEMVRWLAEYQITEPEEIKGFNRLGYTYHKALSTYTNFVFIKGGSKDAASR
ncbi:MAG: peroxide stress protein YaaA [Sporomusaceae bacterium]|nr:peroxide stress protein YaaA [Sporomusaceae bacterium]